MFRTEDILDAHEDVPELEALTAGPWCCTTSTRGTARAPSCAGRAEIGDDDFVVAFHPRNRDVMAFIDRVKRAAEADQGGAAPARGGPAGAGPAGRARRPYPPVRVREAFAVQPKLEALAIVRGEHVCDNDDLIRNASYSWSPMSADEIRNKTGIEQRRYTSREPEELALHAARAALAQVRPRAGGDRRRAGLHLHQQPADPVDRQLAVRPARHAADPRLGRPRRGVRRAALRAGRGRSGCCRRSSARCCWSAWRSSPTRSAASARRG